MPADYSIKETVADYWDEDSKGYPQGSIYYLVYYLDKIVGDSRTYQGAIQLAVQHSKLKR